jgi:hypothetical protein
MNVHSCRRPARLCILLIAFCGAKLCAQQNDYVVEGYPPDVLASLEIRDRANRNLPSEMLGQTTQYVFTIANKWTGEAGKAPVVTVAFLGGGDSIRQEIAAAANQWTQYAFLKFDFLDPQTEKFREWSASYKVYRADIRIAFDQAGYWSLVGNDSVDSVVRMPGQASMNFGRFLVGKPTDWKTIVQHEFGHALGLQHEHQTPLGGCDSDWKWYDDPGYVPTTKANGAYGPDQYGRKPGIYTYLGGYPNYWPQSVVDHNLKQLNNDDHAYDQGEFDRTSIMKYYFPPEMFVAGDSSHCFSGENQAISAEDQSGIKKWYPAQGAALSEFQKVQRLMLNSIVALQGVNPSARESYQLQLNRLEVK